jgi:hypothetical protein
MPHHSLCQTGAPSRGWPACRHSNENPDLTARLFHLTVYFACLDADGGEHGHWARLDQLDEPAIRRAGVLTLCLPISERSKPTTRSPGKISSRRWPARGRLPAPGTPPEYAGRSRLRFLGCYGWQCSHTALSGRRRRRRGIRPYAPRRVAFTLRECRASKRLNTASAGILGFLSAIEARTFARRISSSAASSRSSARSAVRSTSLALS